MRGTYCFTGEVGQATTWCHMAFFCAILAKNAIYKNEDQSSKQKLSSLNFSGLSHTEISMSAASKDLTPSATKKCGSGHRKGFLRCQGKWQTRRSRMKHPCQHQMQRRASRSKTTSGEPDRCSNKMDKRKCAQGTLSPSAFGIIAMYASRSLCGQQAQPSKPPAVIPGLGRIKEFIACKDRKDQKLRLR